MISTMPKSGSAPTSPNALPGGLGAILQQPGGAPKGASSGSIQQILDRARTMSDMQLSDVLAGKSLDVPQYVAMTEAMGRKSLRTAVQGAQAQQGKQPSLKEKLLTEEAQAQAAQQMAQNVQGGLDQLPAPNMDSMDMAGGGIVAFDEGGLSRDQVQAAYDAWQESKGPWYLPTPAGSGAKEKEQAYKDILKQYQAIQGTQAQMAPRSTPTIDSTPNQAEINAIRATAAPEGGPTQAQRDAFYEKAAPKKTGIAALTAAEEAPKNQASEDYLAKLAGIGDKTRAGIAGLKNEAQSQVLFDAMSALMGNRNLAEAGSKFGQLAAGRVGTMGKEGRALEKEANDYDLNLAKYREAVESGDQDRALQYKKMMLENQSRLAAINKPGEAMQLLSALGDPEMMKRYQEMNAAKKPTNVISKDTALKEWGDMLPSQKRQYGNDFNAFYSSVSNSTMGGGSDLAAAAAAELARRKK